MGLLTNITKAARKILGTKTGRTAAQTATRTALDSDASVAGLATEGKAATDEVADLLTGEATRRDVVQEVGQRATQQAGRTLIKSNAQKAAVTSLGPASLSNKKTVASSVAVHEGITTAHPELDSVTERVADEVDDAFDMYVGDPDE